MVGGGKGCIRITNLYGIKPSMQTTCNHFLFIPSIFLGVVSTTNSLGLEINSHDPLGAKVALDKVLERLVSLAALVVVLHVIHAGELSLGDKRVSLRSGILISGTNDHGEDIRFAVLEVVSTLIYEIMRGKIVENPTFCWEASSLWYWSNSLAWSSLLGSLNMVIRCTRLAILTVVV